MYKYVHFVLTITFLMVFGFFASPAHAAPIPFSSSSISDRLPFDRPGLDLCSKRANQVFNSLPTLREFAASIENGDPTIIVGVYVCQVLALKIAQQPPTDPVFVSTEMGTATQFRLAAAYGTLGLLAHNDRSGAQFSGLQIGQEVDVIYGDGMIRRYSVKNIRHFKPINSEDPYSNFLDVDNGGDPLTSSQVFQQIFVGNDQVVFQTCITADGNPTWGRLFISATPMLMN